MTSRRPQTRITPLTRRVVQVGVALAVLIMSLGVQAGAASSALYVDQGNPYAVASPGTSTLDFSAYVSGAAPGTGFYADDVALTRG
jgi:hypothetical protein